VIDRITPGAFAARLAEKTSFLRLMGLHFLGLLDLQPLGLLPFLLFRLQLLAKCSEHTKEFWYHFRLKPEHASYLNAFAETRRMRRDPAKAGQLPDPHRLAVGLPIGDEGAYFTGGTGDFGQGHDASVLDGNRPPRGQPGFWCQWVPDEHGTAIQWNGAERFYHYVEWLEYLTVHFLGPWGYVLNGQVQWQGEDAEDRGTISMQDNEVQARAEPGNR